ncbi:MAG: GNAT family N-acetyltransferase [Myxococcota bacterium]
MRDGLWTGPGESVPDWAPVFDLLDAGFPQLPARAAQAAALGAPWAKVTTPFVWFEGGAPVAHVGVLAHPLRLAGEDRVVAGVHAVCSRPDHRGRGHVRRLLEAACEWIDGRFDAAKLHTDYPDLYAKVGFEVAPTHRFHTRARGGGGPAVRLDPYRDHPRIDRALAGRSPVSDALSTRDPGWLTWIDAALARGLDRWFVGVPDAPWIAAAEVRDRVLYVYDVIGPELPSADGLLGAIGESYDRVEWSFSPERFDPQAAAVEVPASEGVLQVRGRWAPRGPVGVSRLWEH